jgi:hypothetical protein
MIKTTRKAASCAGGCGRRRENGRDAVMDDARLPGAGRYFAARTPSPEVRQTVKRRCTVADDLRRSAAPCCAGTDIKLPEGEPRRSVPAEIFSAFLVELAAVQRPQPVRCGKAGAGRNPRDHHPARIITGKTFRLG